MLLDRITCVAYMRPISTNGAAWSFSGSVGLLVTIVSPAKAAEPIETLLRGADALDQGITYQIRVFIGTTWRIQWIDLCGDVARIIVVTCLQPNFAILSDLII